MRQDCEAFSPFRAPSGLEDLIHHRNETTKMRRDTVTEECGVRRPPLYDSFDPERIKCSGNPENGPVRIDTRIRLIIFASSIS